MQQNNSRPKVLFRNNRAASADTTASAKTSFTNNGYNSNGDSFGNLIQIPKFIDKLAINECNIKLCGKNASKNDTSTKYTYIKKHAKQIAAFELLLKLQNGLKDSNIIKHDIDKAR